MRRLHALPILCLPVCARAHEAFFGPQAFAWTTGSDELAWPLTGARYGARWLFRGYNASTAKGSIALTAGQTVDLQIGCNRQCLVDHSPCLQSSGDS